MAKIIKDNSMAPASCRTHRHASREILYNTWSSHTSHISHHVISHITSQHTLQKQVRRPLIVVASFTWLLRVSSKNDSYLRKNHNGDIKVAISPSTRTASVESDSTKVGETDTRQPSYATKLHVSRWNRSLVSVRVRLVRAASSHSTAESRKD